MKIWLLRRPKDQPPLYDAHFGFIILANVESRARELASRQQGDENDPNLIEASPWLDPNRSKATVIGLPFDHIVEGVVLADFNAG